MKQTSTRTHVFVIILNWNGAPDTCACLASLQTCNREDIELSVVVVDNGSTDDSIKTIEKDHPWVTVIALGENKGFSGGNNAGIQYALKRRADVIWLLNNDTIVDKDVLIMMRVFDDSRVGACGSKIYFSKNREFHYTRYKPSERGKVMWYAGGIIDWKNMYASHRGVDEVDWGQYDSLEETAFITGCSLMIRADTIRSVGLLDERFFLYLEDVDWNIRMQKAGWKTMYDPKSMLWHNNASSSGRPGNTLHDYYFTRNRLLLGFRYAPIRTKIALMRESLRIMLQGSPTKKQAIRDAYIGRFGKQYESTSLR